MFQQRIILYTYIMDAFKLLSRSTTLSAKSKRSPAPPKIPSSGDAPTPQVFLNTPPVNGASSEKSNRKRKRGQDVPKVDSTVENEVDFFGADKSQSAAPASTKEHEPKAYPKVTIPRLAYDESKRLLRSHKIKTSQIWSPPLHEENGKIRKKEKKSKSTAEAVTENAGKKQQKAEHIIEPLTSFSHLRPRFGVASGIAENLDEQGYSTPTEIQLGALPLLLGSEALTAEVSSTATDSVKTLTADALPNPSCDVDLLSVAPTGSGKTLAFLIPVLAGILEQRRVARRDGSGDIDEAGPKAIIIAPTKELASQITNEGRKLSKQTGVKVTMVKKGMNILSRSEEQNGSREELEEDEESEEEDENDEEEEKKDNAGTAATQNPKKDLPPTKADVLVSTPLTLLHAITSRNGHVQALNSVRYIVLDEADVLLDPLFRDQTLAIWKACTSPLLRASLWSATMGSSIEDLAMSTIAERWATLETDQPRAPLMRLVVGLKDSALPTISHKLIYCATEQGKLMALRNLIRPRAAGTNAADKTPALRAPFLIFTQTIPRAIALHSELLYDIPAEAGGSTRLAVLHADLTDTARENIMARFRKGEIWILITTDLLSRGVDFRGLNGVVNYDFPSSSAAYVHRVGRTGRAGREGGVAVTLYAKEDVPFVKNVANVIAASEKLQKGGKIEGQGVQQWLLDALPKPTKREKQELKKRGVMSRNISSGEGSSKSRISTKSGYERKVENDRKGAIEGAKMRKQAELEGEVRVGQDGADDFGGFDD